MAYHASAIPVIRIIGWVLKINNDEGSFFRPNCVFRSASTITHEFLEYSDRNHPFLYICAIDVISVSLFILSSSCVWKNVSIYDAKYLFTYFVVYLHLCMSGRQFSYIVAILFNHSSDLKMKYLSLCYEEFSLPH